ncbi:MAG: nucleotide exchange factor GrpE [Synergistaceae bacterium]|jgi:molecular chaperone GrpE|nr:nucleotide exchange factor GrpE [Synergistaceae bacterium]
MRTDWIDGIGDMEEDTKNNMEEDMEEDAEQDEDVQDDIREKRDRKEKRPLDRLGSGPVDVGKKENGAPEKKKDEKEKEPEKPKEASDAEGVIESLRSELALARADLYNYRQRVERDRARNRKLISEDRAAEFLPVLDNLDRALLVPEDTSAKDVLMGVRMVQRQFLSVLEDMGVTVISAEGGRFNPQLHNAVETEFVDDPAQDEMVLSELVRGYKTSDRVLRAAHVRVGKLRSDKSAD